MTYTLYNFNPQLQRRSCGLKLYAEITYWKLKQKIILILFPKYRTSVGSNSPEEIFRFHRLVRGVSRILPILNNLTQVTSIAETLCGIYFAT